MGLLASTLQTKAILMCTLPLRVMSRLMWVYVNWYCWIHHSLANVVSLLISYFSWNRSVRWIIGSNATKRPVGLYRPASPYVVAEWAGWLSCQDCRWTACVGFALLDSTGMGNGAAVVSDWQAVGLLSRGPVNVSDGSLPGPWEKKGSQVPFLKFVPVPQGIKRKDVPASSHLRGPFSLHLCCSFVLTSSKMCHVGQLWLSLARVAGGQRVQEAVLVGSDAAERTNRTVEKWEGALWRPGEHNVPLTYKTC